MIFFLTSRFNIRFFFVHPEVIYRCRSLGYSSLFMLERACDLLLRVQAPNRAECGRKGPPLLGEDKMDGL